MKRPRLLQATLLGLTLGALLAFGLPYLRPAPEAARILSDCNGAIRTLAIHYTRPTRSLTLPIYRDMLTALPGDVTVRVVVRETEAFEELIEAIGPLACRLTPVVVDHPITTWSRDRWLAVRDPDHITLLHPWMEMMREGWPDRQGDEQVADDLANADPEHVRAERSVLYFDGGDFACDRSTVFVTPSVLERNVGLSVKDAGALQQHLINHLGRDVVLLDHAPPHHAGMFMMPIGDNRVFVGDPSLAWSQLPDDTVMPVGLDMSETTQAAFDTVARRCARAGYEVIRMPIVPGEDGRTYLTWLNVIIDERPDGPVVYMPVFDSVARLNDRAEAIWREAGYTVRRVNCTTVYTQFGSLRCLVNVVDRSGP